MGNGSGPDNVRPPHLKIVQPFHLSRYPITVGQFAQFVRETGYQTDAELNHGDGAGCRVSAPPEQAGTFQAGLSWRNPGFAQSDDLPVVCVSYNDSHAFLAWLNGRSSRHYRLPSEAEWEFTTRASSEANAENCPKEGPGSAPTSACATQEHQPVDAGKPNRFGVYDLAGPGIELVEDCWHADYRRAPRTGSAWLKDCTLPQQITVIGPWSSEGNGAFASRASLGQSSADTRLGFRIAENSPTTGTDGSTRY